MGRDLDGLLPSCNTKLEKTLLSPAVLGGILGGNLRCSEWRHVPVYKGADRSIDGQSDYETVYFGPDNFGGASGLYPIGRNPAPDPQAHAYLKVIDIVRANPGRHTIVAMAPLTNLAIALLVEPDFLENVEHLYILGGTLYVLRSSHGDIRLQAGTQSTYNSITKKTGPLQTFLRDTTSYTVQCCLQDSPGFNVGDFLAVLAATVPESVQETVVHRVDVELAGTYTRGQLVHAWQPKDLPYVKRNTTIVKRFNTRLVEQYFKQVFDPPRRG
ncbi:hypothetical protein HPB48_022170 [Haemaphysalis longicornis]|uniref:Inosine/uridine-preferring nucleoside hydrolase domain-containing protein n=1 Tax=Haemaphysalis longicornis TaxID=44386 RepID=A0A9J6G9X4_HAELO|nr:hypothetical protein HPB48_022170 [Haemaphysalis longicornis]